MIDWETEKQHLRQAGWSEGATHHIVELMWNHIQEQDKRLTSLTKSVMTHLSEETRRKKKILNKGDSNV